MRIALGQLESGADIRSNLAAVDRYIARAALDGATLVAFPEYATYEKKKVDATFPEVAEPLDGPVCEELAGTARLHRIALVARVVETSDEPVGRTTRWWLSGPTATDWLSTGRSTSSTHRASGSPRSSSRGHPRSRWCSSMGERASAS